MMTSNQDDHDRHDAMSVISETLHTATERNEEKMDEEIKVEDKIDFEEYVEDNKK